MMYYSLQGGCASSCCIIVLITLFPTTERTADTRYDAADDTVEWVISELEKIAHVDIPIGVIPFGTGNDMARILGWGASAPEPLIGGSDMPALKQIIRNLATGEILALDVWRVETSCDPEKGRFDVAIKGEIVERADKAKTVVDHMINYCSFGQDARAVFGFERHRRTTQFLNKVQFAVEGGKLSLQSTRRLTHAKLVVDEDEFPDAEKRQGMIFQNIPSYAAGSDFWDATAKWTPGEKFCPQMVGDGLLEVHALERIFDIALHKATLGMRDATNRFAQGKVMKMIFDSEVPLPMYFQVDGEPCRITAPVSCEIAPAFQVRMIQRNDAKTGLLRSLHKGEKGTASSHIIHSAYVLKARKHSENDSWRSRYAAIVNREHEKMVTLEWFRDTEYRNRIVIAKDGKVVVEIAKLDHGGKRPNTCFTVKAGKKVSTFALKSEAERDEWVELLKNPTPGLRTPIF